MTIDATAGIVFLLLAVSAGAAYARAFPGKKNAIVLWSVRCGALIMLACAFYQPAIKLKTLAADRGRAAVLIDASKSMGLFKLDSILKILPGIGAGPGAHPPPKTSVRFYYFGDSLRPCDPATAAAGAFTDKNSYFPSDLSAWGTIVILSDGNWSNPSLLADAFESKNCYYIPLPPVSPRPFLSGECISFTTPVFKDSVSRATIRVKGYSLSGDPLEIEVGSDAHRLYGRKLTVAAGYFSDTLSLAFPTNKAGRFLYAIRIKKTTDTLDCRLNLVGDVVPSVLSAALVSPTPALDERFLSLAISGDPAWKTVSGEEAARTADAMFFTDWDAWAKKWFSLLKPSGVAVFVGCLPCSTSLSVVPDTFALVAAHPDDSLAQGIVQRALPSPARLVVCDRAVFAAQRTRLGCVARKKTSFRPGAGAVANDTLPFLFEGIFGGRACIALAARDIWRMEFLPLGLDQENESGTLMRDVMSLVKESARSGLARSFFVYPLAPEAVAYDSCVFSIVAPPELTAAGRISPGRPAGRIEFIIRQGEKRVMDTSFAAVPGELSGVQTLRCPALPAGTYAYSATLSFEKKKYSWSDTLEVRANDLELSIPGQNTVLLGQIAVPLSGNDPRAFSEIVSRDPGLAGNATIDKVYQIKRSWWLWGMIVALFSLEWALRRKFGLDA